MPMLTVQVRAADMMKGLWQLGTSNIEKCLMWQSAFFVFGRDLDVTLTSCVKSVSILMILRLGRLENGGPSAPEVLTRILVA